MSESKNEKEESNDFETQIASEKQYDQKCLHLETMLEQMQELCKVHFKDELLKNTTVSDLMSFFDKYENDCYKPNKQNTKI